MKCNTRDFGEIELSPSDIIEFIHPPFGFEDYTKYILLFDDEIQSPFAFLQSTEDPHLCFTLIDTTVFSSIYTPQYPQNVFSKLGEGDIQSFGICVVPADISKATVNLKSPILIGLTSHKGLQVILAENYPIRHPLMETED